MIKVLLKISLAGTLCCAVAFGAAVIIPNSNSGSLGGDNSGTLPTSPFSAEVQQVFAPSQFPAGTISITGFNWRAIPGATGAVHVTVSGTIFLAYSQNAPNALSSTFANNVGANNTLVLTASGLAINDPGCVAGPTPCQIGNSNFVFTTPFTYNPANGPLLIDAKITSFVSTGTGEWDVADCGVACPANGIVGSPLGSATGSVNDSNNVTQIFYTTVSTTPVPPSILLTLVGLACVGFYFGSRGFAKLA